VNAARVVCAALVAALGLGALALGSRPAPAVPSAARGAAGPPARLADTGLYRDFAAREVAPECLPFEPQYPLWTDGALKRRWIALPAGAAIDARDADHWDFPVGTRLWKEFAFERPIETRYMEKLADGSWLFATYLWDADGGDAPLAPARGARGVCESSPGVPYDVPGRADCLACHGGRPERVLGFGALQLSSARSAPTNGMTLESLAQRGLLANLRRDLLDQPPRIAARSETERAALGWLHGNCGGCHNARGPLERLGLELDQPLERTPRALDTLVERAAHTRTAVLPLRVVPGDPDASDLLAHVASTDPLTRMPPLGTRAPDRAAVDLLARWIREDLAGPASNLRN
jgi:mono/diheme cytochrome c family protein